MVSIQKSKYLTKFFLQTFFFSVLRIKETQLPAEGEKEGKLKRLIVDCNLLIGVNGWVHWLIRSSAHMVILLCQGECKTIDRIKIHTKYMGADSPSRSPSKRPLVDRNREIDFLK